MRNASKGKEIPLECLHGNFLEIPFHTLLQKVRGFVDELISDGLTNDD
jgi:hypothetical protein